MTEYIIIVALIAIAAIGVISIFGNNIRGLFGSSANVLNGNDVRSNTMSDSADTYEKKNFTNFESNNNGI